MNEKEEKVLRQSIRHLIEHVKQKKANEKEQLKSVIRDLLKYEKQLLVKEAQTPDVDPVPNKSTGINALEELLKKIIPVLETDYKSLTTDTAQRDSFRAHIINAVVNTLTPARVNTDAGDEEHADVSLALQEVDIEEEIEISVPEISPEDEKFIGVRPVDVEDEEEEEPQEEEDPRDEFGAGVEGDETGRNFAYQSFKKIESSIIDSYELLGNDEDQELFYDYIIANLKLYFDKFEEELSSAVNEPSNQAYDMAKSEQEPEMAPM